jgi:hypothetical protein
MVRSVSKFKKRKSKEEPTNEGKGKTKKMKSEV